MHKPKFVICHKHITNTIVHKYIVNALDKPMSLNDQLSCDIFGKPSKLQVNDVEKKIHMVIYRLRIKLQVGWLHDEF